MATSTIIFDSTFIHGSRANGEAAWDEPLPGASLCAWLSLGMVMPWAPPKYVPKTSDFLRVIDAVIALKGFPTGKDVFRYYGPPPYSSIINYAPKTTPHSFQLDWEATWLERMAPSYYADIITAIRTKHPGIRLLTFVPGPLQGFNDSALKTQYWTPTADVLNGAKAYAQQHASWIDQLWGIVITCYFGAPKFDQSTIWWTYNLIKLARQVFPNRRIVIQTMGSRNESWYPAGGLVSDQIVDQFAGVIRSAHPDGVIIWGLRSSNLKMLAAFGVQTNPPPAPLQRISNIGGAVYTPR